MRASKRSRPTRSTPSASNPSTFARGKVRRAGGIPSRAFDLDHYDVPEDAVPRLIAAGAQHVSGRELVTRLIASGLRVTARERRGL